MPLYDPDYSDPPAPIAYVTVRTTDKTKSVGNIPMLLDTGADTTLLPRLALASLGLAEERADFDLLSFDGQARPAMGIRVEMEFLDKRFRGLYLLTDMTHGVLGRDILNLLRLVFDGPRLIWGEVPPMD